MCRNIVREKLSNNCLFDACLNAKNLDEFINDFKSF